MKTNEYISYTKVVTHFQVEQKDYLAFVDQIRKDSEETLTPSQLLEIKEASEKRKESLDSLRTQMKKLQEFFPIETYKNLMNSIENEYALVEMLGEDCEKFIKEQDNKYLESVLYGLGEEKEYNDALSKSLSDVEYRFGISILNEALTGSLEIQDIKDIALSLDVNTPLRQNLDNLITDLERKEAKAKREESEPKEEPIEEEEKKEEEAKEEKTVSLEEKIAHVNYAQKGNIVKEVQQLTIDDRLEQIEKQLTELHSKEKLTLKDRIALQRLAQEKLDLSAYKDTLERGKQTSKENRRDKNISKTDASIEAALENLEQSRENYEAYDSKIMRFFSMRYQEQLQVNIQKLQDKRGVLQQQQRISAVAKFDKKSGQIARKAAVLGTVRGVKDQTREKIEELRELKNQVAQEFQSFKSDISRFTSHREEIPELQEKAGTSLDNIISIEEVRRMQKEGVKAA